MTTLINDRTARTLQAALEDIFRAIAEEPAPGRRWPAPRHRAPEPGVEVGPRHRAMGRSWSRQSATCGRTASPRRRCLVPPDRRRHPSVALALPWMSGFHQRHPPTDAPAPPDRLTTRGGLPTLASFGWRYGGWPCGRRCCCSVVVPQFVMLARALRGRSPSGGVRRRSSWPPSTAIQLTSSSATAPRCSVRRPAARPAGGLGGQASWKTRAPSSRRCSGGGRQSPRRATGQVARRLEAVLQSRAIRRHTITVRWHRDHVPRRAGSASGSTRGAFQRTRATPRQLLLEAIGRRRRRAECSTWGAAQASSASPRQ